MSQSLANIIRLITTKGQSEFISSLKEELDDRLHERMATLYVDISENLYIAEKEEMVESVDPKNELVETQVLSDKPVIELIASLQESIRDEKTIVHRFVNGESVTITHDDSQNLVNLHDSLNRINQEKMRKLMSESYSEYNKILQFSRKHTERTHK